MMSGFVTLKSRPELKKISFTFPHEQNQSSFDCHTKSSALFKLGLTAHQLKSLTCPLLSC